MKKKIVSVMMTAVVAAATVFSVAVPAFAADTVKIGVYEPASGDNGAGGKQETLGIRDMPTVKHLPLRSTAKSIMWSLILLTMNPLQIKVLPQLPPW